ncbi:MULTISPECIES: AbrB antirepressor AbbA [Bacillus]|uniref:AbrB antirepressor AbbA n=1 Tax=Bacillus TaxID=1386 RepID=UPI0009E240AE|nr:MULTISPECIES: AbrB antirepressor AbbA [Bacillus]MBC9024547.1 antirepressor AbbA [Bacillus subtilis]MCH4865049.1 AbrB antirepressor AbbA [Bacillus sp. 1006-3]MCJ2149463.1 AbrB antirepressor AbbA [Bacillus subtilis]MCR4380005.1 AbrB antirepressor AbbA [Bacillus subtilis]QGI34535.1 antirepressor AbbA [Bacillus subtilis]
MRMSLIGERFTEEEQKLLLNILINHEYAIELLSSEINDIETRTKNVDGTTYKKLVTLYDRFRFEN